MRNFFSSVFFWDKLLHAFTEWGNESRLFAQNSILIRSFLFLFLIKNISLKLSLAMKTSGKTSHMFN